MKGWIRIHRSICNNHLWFSEPFTRAQAWVDLLILANHRQTVLYKRGIKVAINRGEVAWSEEALAARWMWSRGKVRRYLKTLEMVQQIVQQKNHTLSRIIILNYSQYQDNDTTDGTTDSTNDNNDNNVNIISSESDDSQSEEKDMPWTPKQADNDDDLPILDVDTGEEVRPKGKTPRHYKEVYAVFGKFMKVPLNWTVNKTERSAAENLYTERGIENVERALRFYHEHKDTEFCPSIHSPYDLDSKWKKLLAFKKKYGNG